MTPATPHDSTPRAIGRRGRRRWLRSALLPVSVAVIVYAAVLARPQMVFAYQVRADNLVLHARHALPAQALTIATAAQQRLRRSPLYVASDSYDVYLCDSPALFAVFAPWHHNVGGIADVYLTRNVWLRPSHIERDRLVGPSGAEASGDRTLTYFIAHEITHIMVARRLGALGYRRLERWQNEGYADYVGKASTFDFDAVRRAFQAGDSTLDPSRSGLYLRYHLLVAELLDGQGLTPAQLLSRPLDPQPIERALLR